ncbi:MAG TPA: TetR/AcrR family transcriptional regulator [Nannocystis exedens]|nr:TetR/AcrR family transcriptional regulator [Nannocystis exedens]
MQLFWRKGYESSSLRDLLAAMGISKSSFYHVFESKHLLFQRCLRHYHQMLLSDLRRALALACSGGQFVSTLLSSVGRECEHRRGCLIMNTASEFALRDAQISELVASSVDEIVELFAGAIRSAQEEGEIGQEHDARVLATYLLSSLSGLRNMVKAGVDRQSIDSIAELVWRALV